MVTFKVFSSLRTTVPTKKYDLSKNQSFEGDFCDKAKTHDTLHFAQNVYYYKI